MALEKYQEYLAAQVLNEGRPVNYRLLSRALKVHTNVAKQMLFEFHRSQNARKPGSIHATYLLTGICKSLETDLVNGQNAHKNDEDVAMNDEPMLSSSLPQPDDEDDDPVETVPTTTITLVQEHHLEDVKKLYLSIDSIHVYSLEGGSLQDLQILSDCSRRIMAETATEDPLESWKGYGSIGNATAKRRKGGRPPPVLAPQLATTAGMKPTGSKVSEKQKADTSVLPAAAKDSIKSEKRSAPRRESSDLFKSFAKTQPPKSKPAEEEDENMMDADDEEDEQFAKAPANNAESKAKAEQARKEKFEREDALKKMMEADDDDADVSDEEPDVPAIDKTIGDVAEDPDVEMEDAGESQGSKKEPEAEAEQATTVNGRRRGRRKVMKKKTTKDADGYLVTKQEPVWESFSEDETAVAPPPSKKITATNASKPVTGKASTGTKKGQGNIMSFFGKK